VIAAVAAGIGFVLLAIGLYIVLALA